MNPPVRFLIDENMREALLRRIARHNREFPEWEIKATQVGDALAPPHSTGDPDLLRWCEANGYILISRDLKTMPGHFNDHVAANHNIRGLFLVRRHALWSEVVECLVMATYAEDSATWNNIITWIP